MKNRSISAAFGLAAIGLTGFAVVPAFADDHDNRRANWNEGRDRQLNHGNEWRREQERQRERILAQERWREAHRYDRYYRRPDVYYAAPPPVYQSPDATMHFTFPFSR
jgi:Ni/Co efflux regulator RcnB